jgi:hypothetical protein
MLFCGRTSSACLFVIGSTQFCVIYTSGCLFNANLMQIIGGQAAGSCKEEPIPPHHDFLFAGMQPKASTARYLSSIGRAAVQPVDELGFLNSIPASDHLLSPFEASQLRTYKAIQHAGHHRQSHKTLHQRLRLRLGFRPLHPQPRYPRSTSRTRRSQRGART